MPVSTTRISGKTVVTVDCSNMNSSQISQIEANLREGSALIARQGQKSAYIITNVSKLAFDSGIKKAFQDYATRNTPYVKESVLVGLDGLQKVIYSAIKALTGRNFILVNTMDEAQRILSSK